MTRILSFFAQNRLLVNLIVFVAIVFGFIASNGLKKDLFPQTAMDTMIVSVIYPGASPRDVEINAVVPIERELSGIAGIKDYTSLTIENGASIYINIDYDVKDKRAVKDEIYRSIRRENISDIPDEVEDIKIINPNPKMMSIYEIGISPVKGVTVTDKELYEFALYLEKRILKIPSVGEVRKNGYRDREIKINVNPKDMENYYVSLTDVVNSIQARNIRTTGGTMQSLQKEQTIVTIGQFKNPVDVKEVIIRSNFEEKRVRIKNVSKVTDGYKKETILFRVNKKKAVTLALVKKENVGVVASTNEIKDFFKKHENEFSKKFQITVLKDSSLNITSLIGVVVSNAVIGFLLVIVILFIFLDFKTSFWTALGIPVSLFIVLSIMYLSDMTLNLLTIGAIITVLGMMVDHGIIIAEIIYENRQKGMSPIDAVVNGVNAVLSPVIVTILTTILAFVPMLSIKGMMGAFIFVFPVIITLTLIVSFFEATIILPNHLAFGKTNKKEKAWFKPLKEWYEKILSFFLHKKYYVVSSFVVIFLLTIALSSETIRGFTLFYDDSSDQIFINMEASQGTSLAQTSKLTAKIEEIVLKNVNSKDRLSVITKIGNHTVRAMDSKGNHENWSQVLINLVPGTERKHSSKEIVSVLRKKFKNAASFGFDRILLEEKIMGPPTGDPVNVKIISNNNKLAVSLQRDVMAYLKTIDGIADIDTDAKEGKEELILEFNYERMAQMGIRVSTVAQTVRTAFEGVVATSIQTTAQRLDFRVKVDDSFKRNRRYLLNLLVPNNQGKLLKLGHFTKIRTQKGRSMINHYNGDRVITVTSQLDVNKITSGQVARKVQKKFAPILRKNPGTYIVYGGEAKETSESLGGLGTAFLLAIMLIYIILILLFKSFSQPLIVLITIPLGLIGALLAFTIHGIPLSFMGIIGIIGLSGVVVNDSVVMVDFINKVVKENKEKMKDDFINQIISGAGQRFRPVILTTLTTVAALLPTVYGIGGDAQFLVPTVMAMAYGLIFASLLTLVFIPSLYLVTLDIQMRINYGIDFIKSKIFKEDER